MGEVFAGRYELVDPIGRGGVGAVWRAWDHRRRRYVAAKVLQQSDAHSLLRFVREQALRIDHPHVLAPASWAADDDKVLFTMDLVAGGSLVHLVGDYGPLPPPLVCVLLDQLLAGLSAVHAEGVVHRDIKPANLLLEATGTARPRLRLSDFGIAMRLGEPRLTETNLVVGTPGYLAPEQLMGAEPDFPADLFAVGLVALYLLEGAKPDAKALVQYFSAHGTPSAPKSIPEPLWQVVASLLQPDPHARFRTATGARKALGAAAEVLPEPGPDDELIEIFDQLGPLPPGFAPEGPLKRAPGIDAGRGGSGRGGSGPGGSGSVGESLGGTGSSSGTGGRENTPGTRGRENTPGTGGRGSLSGAAGTVSSAGFAHSTGMAGSAGSGAGAWAGPDASGSDAALHDPRRGVTGPGLGASPAAAPAPDVTPPQSGSESTPRPDDSSGPLSMSDTGSFHLPPPQSTGSVPQTPHPTQRPLPQPPQAPPLRAQGHGQGQAGSDAHNGVHHPSAHSSPYDTTHVLSSPQSRPPHYPAQLPTTTPVHPQPVDASTASYTAQSPQVPPSAPPLPQPNRRGGHRAARRTPRRAARRPGPPAKVTVPLLLLALACYAVGFWALAQI
ncbi:serine/threonine-protein kinase [Streptomyces sp. NPDC098781]|uniref:serine/threonine-protein kinase n=1 Tax=Streptomyces sp. NPDC098781 TaxID=3366097 RepID=UPI0037FC5124